MERFQDGSIVVKLGQGSIQLDEKCVVDTRMANVMTNGGDHQDQGVERLENPRHRVVDDLCVGTWEGRHDASRDKKMEHSLRDIASMSEVVIDHEAVVDLAGSQKESEDPSCNWSKHTVEKKIQSRGDASPSSSLNRPNPGISRMCWIMRKTAYRSSSSLNLCAENDHDATEFATVILCEREISNFLCFVSQGHQEKRVRYAH